MKNLSSSRHRFALASGGVIVIAVVGLLLWGGRSPPASAPPTTVGVSTYSPAELCRRYKGKTGDGASVLVYFPLRPVPTADPLVWEYRPGDPPANFPPTVVFHFTSPISVPPREVTGRVSGWQADFSVRASRAGGALLVEDCSPAEPLPP